MKIFLKINAKILIGMLIGLILGFIHWYYWGCYWGTYPMSSECWFNCSIGLLFGGLVVCMVDNKKSTKC